MEMRATVRGDEVLNERAAPAEAAVARRNRREDIVVDERLKGQQMVAM